MPLDRSIKKVLVIGAGPIVIGQACEFDYSGVQACKALKEEGCKVILLNSNPSTVMTDMADAVYIEPITSDIVEKILSKERPDALLPTMGGQTALNCTKELGELGLLDRYGVRLIGLTFEALEKAENRVAFKEAMTTWGIEVPSGSTDRFPLIVRASFALGGSGGGVAHNEEELSHLLKEGAIYEESLIGWKEFELELLSDHKGNGIVVCGIENVDPMGVHTGDSMTVAPIQTLTDKEYQLMRKRSFDVMKAIGMRSGACNVQFAVHPKSGRMLCIEVNPRVSRSSALASKATGFPIAKIATKLALGYTLDELGPFFFEPTLDYVAVKIPRFNFDKFKGADQSLTTHMKSVGEVMGIGRTFKEALNKALSSLEGPLHSQQGIDPWFSSQMDEIKEEEKAISSHSLESADFSRLLRWKRLGISDKKVATLLKCQEEDVAKKRRELNIHPVYKRIDSCSAEFPIDIPCMYSTYEDECESAPTSRKKILVLGSGANRIGQGIEFDYCCVHAVNTIQEMGYEAIMLNSNPETVSTDYDTTDRLYFEPLTQEHISEVIRIEKPLGVIAQFGGQTPLTLSKTLPLLGTPYSSIDLAEDREKFRSLIKTLGIRQPNNAVFSTPKEALDLAYSMGFPLILRPSYILGGNAIEVIEDESQLKSYLEGIPFTPPVLIESFLKGAIEVEVDAISDGEDVAICGIVEHVEPAGIHSGDSMSFLSTFRLRQPLAEALISQTRRLGLAMKVVGLYNVQFAILDGEIFVLEMNPRASRTVPLLSKTTGMPIVSIATKCILGVSLKKQGVPLHFKPKILGLKLPVFPFTKLRLQEEPLGPMMKSTGEVLCIGKSFNELFIKARIFANQDNGLFTSKLDQQLPHPDSAPLLEVYDLPSIGQLS